MLKRLIIVTTALRIIFSSIFKDLGFYVLFGRYYDFPSKPLNRVWFKDNCPYTSYMDNYYSLKIYFYENFVYNELDIRDLSRK
ncbi:hypothetical protein O3G_MSEX001860 [Manduca sexta]|uniref:Uncharacterized protein n=1 Tax=Manduca sexta TaxID=7130 RepID=A0A922CD92_MANSE|nr:hypothetical protein O3G_MSEX001860 [Manduca sexta]KAG6441530.1 hypothetical protein O3G_MSEX001860 [Manduca sexta]KAG6441531.1 hypothetical protein O3G_MSEX001860 [Manduca sexta]KAG6441532.1 hypothetical protein O3G_MSEX001860 [Manduca sexta]